MSKPIILHCDMDNYFAAVEEKYNPKLKNVPFAVCGDPEMRHSIVMSKNIPAKKAGVLTGISFHQAKKICPSLYYVKADLGKYLAETKLIRDVFAKYGEVVPYGMDEAWIQLGTRCFSEGGQIAKLIQIEIRFSLNLSVSTGVGDNLIFSKIGSDLNKPGGITEITPANYKNIVWGLPASKLLFVGPRRAEMLARCGMHTIGDIACADPFHLAKLLGKNGYDLWSYANGDDRAFNPASESIGSVGNTITPPRDLRSKDDVAAVLYLLSKAVSERLKKHDLRASCVSITYRDASFNRTSKQRSLAAATNEINEIFNKAYLLFTGSYKWSEPLRSIGIRADNLTTTQQLTLIPPERQDPIVDISNKLKAVLKRFGELKLEESAGLRI